MNWTWWLWDVHQSSTCWFELRAFLPMHRSPRESHNAALCRGRCRELLLSGVRLLNLRTELSFQQDMGWKAIGCNSFECTLWQPWFFALAWLAYFLWVMMIEPTEFFSAPLPFLAGLETFMLENNPMFVALLSLLVWTTWCNQLRRGSEAEVIPSHSKSFQTLVWLVNELHLSWDLSGWIYYPAKFRKNNLWSTVHSHLKITVWPGFFQPTWCSMSVTSNQSTCGSQWIGLTTLQLSDHRSHDHTQKISCISPPRFLMFVVY